MIKKQNKNGSLRLNFPIWSFWAQKTLLVKTWLKEVGQNEISVHIFFQPLFTELKFLFFRPKMATESQKLAESSKNWLLRLPFWAKKTI